ncbi:GlcG/HbpS family heme-binding protein [Duganella radicis]|uniref:Heme-binding protein n=1 Tax=Duganella radicis TaxID=551988 RepID=A0A6L6PPV6_9BURK|nr:heme-binding protein [Duganella radicis]MTV41090.1 hypothetical protein [Duganella radicis]
MHTKHTLTMKEIWLVASASEAHALAHGWDVTIAIVDDGGHPLWLQRLDGAAPVSAHVALSKAHTAALARRDTKAIENMINDGRFAFLSAPGIRGMLEGGVALMIAGQCVGAVGVSGVLAADDACIAQAGAQALYDAVAV